MDGQIIHPDPKSPEYFLAFDLLNYQDRDISDFSLHDRKGVLEFLLSDAPDRLLFSSTIEGNPKKIVQEAKKRGFHIVAARKKDSPYKSSPRLDVKI
jgi:bifunctional non-homologous end joining protein LigD